MKKIILFLSSLLLASSAFAESIQLPKYIETTNIDTNDYVWNVKVHTTGVTNTVSKVVLLNPHPELTAYNERAKQIARNKSFRSLTDEEITRNVPKEFSLPIEFKQGIQVNPKRINRFREEAGKLCAIIQSDVIKFTTRLTMTGNGKVTSVYIYANDFSYYFKLRLHRVLKRNRMIYPYNENGILVDNYSVKIPLIIHC